jgi:hypothetical protein
MTRIPDSQARGEPKYLVTAVTFRAIGSGANGSGRRPLRHAFQVVDNRRPDHKRVARAFTQGDIRKWSPEYEAELRGQAEAWAAYLAEIHP